MRHYLRFKLSAVYSSLPGLRNETFSLPIIQEHNRFVGTTFCFTFVRYLFGTEFVNVYEFPACPVRVHFMFITAADPAFDYVIKVITGTVHVTHMYIIHKE